jgi:hypothetical protein
MTPEVNLPQHQFFYVVVDSDKKQFTVEGPMSDDNAWNKAVVAAQGNDREINGFAVPTTTLGSADAVADRYAAEYKGYQRMSAGSIVRPWSLA